MYFSDDYLKLAAFLFRTSFDIQTSSLRLSIHTSRGLFWQLEFGISIMGGVMAAKTCLLCGKPLSRIWAGTGEDFCSREHRNTYRLRKGMDRLLEANKVANVMRRRESPRPIP